MALEMRGRCEQCSRALDLGSDALICSYECTFCPECAAALGRCPNCGGEFSGRPKRATPTVTPRAVVRRLHEIWSRGEVDAVGEVCAPDFVSHFPQSSHLPERRGIAGAREGLVRIKAAFPDWNEAIDDMVAEGNKVVTRYTSTGTHLGEFRGVAASGRKVVVPEMSIYRVQKGKVVEQWCLLDELGRLRQIGGAP